METAIDRVLSWMNQLEREIDTFLLEHSGIYKWHRRDFDIQVVTPTPYAWEDLEPEGRIVQSRLLNEFARWCELSNAVLAGSAESILRYFASAQDDIHEVIDQSNQTYCEDIGRARQRTKENFSELRTKLEPLKAGRDGPPLLVPDTNALLYEPKLEDWEFEACPRFELVLLPAVLSELDKLKINYRTDSVRQKSEKLIRQIKGYRARGPLTAGVPLRRGRSSIRAEAVEPRETTALSWMSWESADDRILTSVIDLMRNSPARPVCLVTRDINLQNKAEFARVPYMEPPELEGRNDA